MRSTSELFTEAVLRLFAGIDNKALRFEQGKMKADRGESSKKVSLWVCSQRRWYHDDIWDACGVFQGCRMGSEKAVD